MTWASQAYNPGSNPGDRIFYAISGIAKQKTIFTNIALAKYYAK
jgi:hypothetical protein